MTLGLGWFYPEESESNSYFPQKIELLVAEQERAITTRETEIRVAIADQNSQLELKHSPTGLEIK